MLYGIMFLRVELVALSSPNTACRPTWWWARQKSRVQAKAFFCFGGWFPHQVPLKGHNARRSALSKERTKMDRNTWLNEMRRDCEEQYDREAPLYDEKGGVYSNIAHQQFIQEFLDLFPQNSRI